VTSPELLYTTLFPTTATPFSSKEVLIGEARSIEYIRRNITIGYPGEGKAVLANYLSR
jgi:hypothetical protein